MIRAKSFRLTWGEICVVLGLAWPNSSWIESVNSFVYLVLSGRYSSFKIDSKLIEGFSPLSDGFGPFFSDVL